MENISDGVKNPNEYSPLTLAFIGDGVYDLLVRDYLVKIANRPVGELNKMKVSFVCCEAQSKLMDALIPELSEQELSVFKRGRNAQTNSTPKNARLADYHKATGFEALFGYLYISGEQERINTLFSLITEKHSEILADM